MPPSDVEKTLNFTSSLNNYCLCDHCGRKFTKKIAIYRHVKNKVCRGVQLNRIFKCDVCKQVFKNKGAMVSHRKRSHGIISPNNNRVQCDACKFTFTNCTRLRIHVRREHFNLIAKVPYCDQKKVNQVWFEKVLNSQSIVEIRKTAPNTLLMRGLDKNTSMKVVEVNTEIIDLSHLYPSNRR